MDQQSVQMPLPKEAKSDEASIAFAKDYFIKLGTTHPLLFRNGSLVAVVVLLRVDLSLQREGYAASRDQWCMHNLTGVHTTGLHFRLIKQNLLRGTPPPVQVCTEVGWDPRLELSFAIACLEKTNKFLYT